MWSKSPWPDMEVAAKDVEAFQRWCRVEETLTYALEDARCPFRFLDASKQGPKLDDLQRQLGAPWGFRDFIRECDYPDDEQFADWCEAWQERCGARAGSKEPSSAPAQVGNAAGL